MLLSFGKGNICVYIYHYLQHLYKLIEVIQKSQTDGLINTFNTVKNKLDFPDTIGLLQCW